MAQDRKLAEEVARPELADPPPILENFRFALLDDRELMPMLTLDEDRLARRRLEFMDDFSEYVALRREHPLEQR